MWRGCSVEDEENLGQLRSKLQKTAKGRAIRSSDKQNQFISFLL